VFCERERDAVDEIAIDAAPWLPLSKKNGRMQGAPVLD
jgi:hypothetical protein